MNHLKKDSTHLELVRTPDSGPLSIDDARQLFDAYFDGFLDEEDQKRVEDALSNSSELRSEFENWQHTFAALESVRNETLDAPPNMRERVLNAIEVEEKNASVATEKSNDNVIAFRQKRWPVLMAEVAIGVAAVCALVVGYQYGSRSQQSPKGVESAGFSQKATPVSFDVTVKGISAADIITAARATKTALMNEPESQVLVFEGNRSEVARFLMELRLKNAHAEVEGVVPRTASQDARYLVNLELLEK